MCLNVFVVLINFVSFFSFLNNYLVSFHMFVIHFCAFTFLNTRLGWYEHRRLCRVQNMLAMYLKYQVHNEHIFDSTQAPVAWTGERIFTENTPVVVTKNILFTFLVWLMDVYRTFLLRYISHVVLGRNNLHVFRMTYFYTDHVFHGLMKDETAVFNQ